MVVLVVLVVLVVTNSPPTPLQDIPDSPHSAMPKRKNSKQPSKQSKILSAGSNFLPLLKKMSSAIGKFIHVPGSYWEGCPAGDKEKIFKCLVVEFITVHDFGFYKSSGFKVRARVALGSLPLVALSAHQLPLCHRLLVCCRLICLYLLCLISHACAGEGAGRIRRWQP